MRRVIKEAAIAAVTGLVLTAAGQAAEANCLPWSSAAPVIAQHSLLPANVIYQMVQARTGGQIIYASLCDENGRFFYKLVVLGAKGDVSNVTVDALTGQP
ncbi:MAG: hypothetical protein WA441_13980 [Methyloceanibacter sp.]|jgi:uncharacterized membrane protein YkoI